MSKSALEQISDLKSQIVKLEQEAVSELKAKRSKLQTELRHLDEEIERITGTAPRAGKGGRVRVTRSLPLQELKELLEKAPGKTLNVRNEKLDFANIKTLAKANPHLLKIAGKGPWPTVTLLK
mgnify:CR=1 FL=1